jgi:hypothetical protein
MLFNESLKNLIAGIEPMQSKLEIESKFREKLPTILEFISGRTFDTPFLNFHSRRNENGCIFHIEHDSFILSSIHSFAKKAFTCDIDFNIHIGSGSIRNVTCQFDEDLNITSFNYQMNFGSFMSGNSFFIQNTKYFDGNHKRKIYLKNVNDHSIVVIEDLNVAVHKEDPAFEDFLAKILGLNYIKPEFYSDAFNYLPSIDLKNTSKMSAFINELHERYIQKDTVLYQSLALLEIHDF